MDREAIYRLTRDEATRLLYGLRQRRQDALDRGDLELAESIREEGRAIKRHLDTLPEAEPPRERDNRARNVLIGAFLVFGAIGVIAGGGEESERRDFAERPRASARDAREASAPEAIAPAGAIYSEGDLHVLSATWERDQSNALSIGGTIQNTGRERSYAQIQINIVDASGAVVDSALDNINNLDAGGTWRFSAHVYPEPPEGSTFAIKGLSGF